MNCMNCNNLIPAEANGTCPFCGTVNNQMPVQQPIAEQVPQSSIPQQASDAYETLDDITPNITADMKPPELNIGNEITTEGVTDIGSANISTYAPEAQIQEEKKEQEEEKREEDAVSIAIPQVTTPVVEDNVKLDENGVPIVETNGEIKPIETNEKKVKMPSIKIPKSIKIGNKDINIPDINGGKPVPMNMMITGLIVCFIIGIVVGKMFFSKSVYIPGNLNNKNGTEVEKVADGKNNITKAGAYTYKIPDAYIYDRRDGGVAILDEADTFRLFIRALPGSYNDLATAKTSVQETIKELGINVNNIKETNLSDKSFLIIESTIKMTNRLLAYTDAGNDYVFYIEIVTLDNTYNYDVLDLAYDIVQNAKYNEKESQMEMIATNDISEIVVKASQEYKELTN